MQLSFKKRGGAREAGVTTLSELAPGEKAVIDRLDLPEDVAKRLMELGFVPGQTIEPALSAPGGEPRVYRIDGSEVALRRETAEHLIVSRNGGESGTSK